ncbi:MAG: hypothetical protein AAGI66_05645 [Cyanobacteria bacterium P01_H01_bin.74]
MSANHWFSLVKREKNLIFIGLALASLFCLYHLFFLYNPTYQTVSKIYIKNIPVDNVVSNYAGSSTVRTESGYSNPLFNYLQIIESAELANRIHQIVKKQFPSVLNVLEVEDANDWINFYNKSLKAKIIPSTDVLQFKFSWPDKYSATAVTNVVLNEYKKFNIEIQRNVMGLKGENIDEQLDKITAQLSAIRQKIENFKRTTGAVDLTQESEQLTISRVALEQQAQLVEAEIAFNNKRISQMKKILKVKSPEAAMDAVAIGQDPYLIKLNEDLATAKQNLEKLRGRFKDEYPTVKASIKEVSSLKSSIKKREKEVLGGRSSKTGFYTSVSSNLTQDLLLANSQKKALEARRNQLKKAILDFKSLEGAIPGKERTLNELYKTEDALKTAYSNLKKSAIESQIKARSIVDNLITLNPPTKPKLSLTPLILSLISYMLLGLMSGLAIAWVKDRLYDRWSSIQELEESTNKIVLGKLPWEKNFDVNNPPNTIYTEDTSYRDVASITSSLIQRSYLEQAQVVSFVSTNNKRKRSSIVRQVAQNLAASSRKVILVDADLEAPTRHVGEAERDGNYIKKSGLMTCIAEMNKSLRLRQEIFAHDFNTLLKQAVVEVQVTEDGCSFDYLTSKQPATRVYDYVASAGFHQLLSQLKQHYEFILVDTPGSPFAYPEVKAVLQESEGVVILSALKASRNKLLQLSRFLDNNNLKTLGIIARV